MKFVSKLILKIAVNAAALYGVTQFFSGFQITDGYKGLLLAATVVSLVHLVFRPLLKLLSLPLLLVTLGLFNVVINFALLWAADAFSSTLTIADTKTLFIASVIIGLVNSIF